MTVLSRHVGIVVEDINKSRYFFESILKLKLWKHETETGLKIENIVGLKGVTIEWMKFKTDDGFIIELLQYHSHPEKQQKLLLPQIGAAHIALTVDNVNNLYHTIIKNGYKCNSTPQNSSKVKVLYCYGPDGITLELVEEKHE